MEILCSTPLRCTVVVAEWTLIIITVPVYFVVVLALIHDLRRSLAKKIFNSAFLTIFFYIAFWDLVSGLKFDDFIEKPFKVFQ